MNIRTSKDKDHPYVILNRSIFHDRNLSLKAMGLLGHCMSMPDGWEFHVNHLQSVLKEGRDAINSAFAELIQYGYCHRIQNKNERGQFRKVEYILYESPVKLEKSENPCTENPFTGKPLTDLPLTENQPLVINNNTVSNEDINIDIIARARGDENQIPIGKFVKLSQDDIDKFVSHYGKSFFDDICERINDYCSNHKPKGYKDYAAAFRNFAKTNQKFEPSNKTKKRPQGKSISEMWDDLPPGNYINGVRVD